MSLASKLSHYYFPVIILWTCVILFLIKYNGFFDGFQLLQLLQSYNNNTNISSLHKDTILQNEEQTRISPTPFTLAKQKLNYEDSLLGSDPAARSCSQEFGVDLIERWKNARLDVCTGFQQSHITCYLREYHSEPRILCIAKNTQIRLYPPFYTSSTNDTSIHSSIGLHDYILNVDCNLNLYKLIDDEWWSRTGSVSNFMTNIRISSQLECNHTINHTILWMYRYDFQNTFHIMEDAITTYESLLVANEDPSQMELVVYDGFHINTQIFALWSKIFGRGVRIIRSDPFPPGSCFSKNLFNMKGSNSHLSNNDGVARPMSCSSPILKSFKYWLKLSLGIQEPKIDRSNNNHNPSIKRRILFLSRRNYNGRNITRVIPNEAELISDIQSRLSSSNWTLELFRPESFSSFEEQLHFLANASILIGVHGAGLTNIIFMPNDAHLIEIFHSDRSMANLHYYNICKWLNMSYHSPGYFLDYVPLKIIWPMIKYVIKQIENT